MIKLSIVIPTLNSEKTLFNTISRVVDKAKVYVIDGGSSDSTKDIATSLNALFTVTKPSRGLQLSTGANLIYDGWILFIHSDTFLGEGWYDEVIKFIKKSDSKKKAGYFKFKFDDNGLFAKLIETFVGLRCRFFSLPYGDQCLLIHKSLYTMVGGFKSISLMEDVDLISRLDKKNLYNIPVFAITSSSRYKKRGYLYNIIKNFLCLIMFKLGFSINLIKLIYES